MTNPYQSPTEANAAQTVGVEHGTKQRRKPGYVVAIWFIVTSVAQLIAVVIVFRLPLPAHDIAAAGIVLIHSTAWAIVGLLRYGRLGFFALGISAFAAFLVLAAAAQILWMSMRWRW